MTHTDLYFVDFDGTLFRTKVFWADFTPAFCKANNITLEVFRDTYVQSKNEKTIYDIDQHIALLGSTRETFDETLSRILEERSYAFPEVETFLKNHIDSKVVIVTQGVEWFQKVKIASVKELAHLPVIVTAYKKRLYIEDTIGFYEDGIFWEGEHYKSLTFIDNTADAFLKEDHGAVFTQYRILRDEVEDNNAKEPTQKYSTEVRTLLDIP